MRIVAANHRHLCNTKKNSKAIERKPLFGKTSASEVLINFGLLHIASPLLGHASCAYEAGVCGLSDGSMLSWEPAAEQRCAFKLMATWKGKRAGRRRVSHGNQFALTLPEKPTEIVECGNELWLTTQSYAVKKSDFEESERRRRHGEPEQGIVMTPQLASQLAYAVEALEFELRHESRRVTWRSACLYAIWVVSYEWRRGSTRHRWLACCLKPMSCKREWCRRTFWKFGLAKVSARGTLGRLAAEPLL